MNNFKFASKVYRDIFKPGKMYDLCQAIANKEKYTPFSEDEFAKLPRIFASYDPRECSLLELEDDKVYKVDKMEVFGRDLKLLAYTMYNKPRSAYLKMEKPQVHNSILCGAVPIPLLGFKRHYGIPYNKWNKQRAYLHHEHHNLFEKEGDLEHAFKIDMLLGKTLASTRYDEKTDTIVWKKGFGLQLLSTLNIDYDANVVNYLRKESMGNYKGHFTTTYGAVKVDKTEEFNPVQIDLYNKCTTEMRLLLTQRWAFYHKHRCEEMITDPNDWDNQVKMVDTTDNIFLGLEPAKEGGISLPKGLQI